MRIGSRGGTFRHGARPSSVVVLDRRALRRAPALRRRRAPRELAFRPRASSPPLPLETRSRSRLEDRALNATRTAAVVALALLGATPFVRCSRLSLQRDSGAPVALAIVLDDLDEHGRRARAREGASRLREGPRERAKLLGSAARGRPGGALVLAGAPARASRSPRRRTSRRRAAPRRRFPERTARPTSKDALALAQSAHRVVCSRWDRRVVVLSSTWLTGTPTDHRSANRARQRSGSPCRNCAPLQAPTCAVPAGRSRSEACARSASPAAPARRRRAARSSSKTARGAGPKGAAGTGESAEVKVTLGAGVAEPARARLAGADAIAGDDVAPVSRAGARHRGR